MSEQLVFVSEELQKKARLIFGLLGVGCLGILVYGAIVGEGSKNWRGNFAAEEQAHQATYQARQNATQRDGVARPQSGAPSPTSPGAVRNQQQTPSGLASPDQPSATMLPYTQDNQVSMTMLVLAEKIQRSSQIYFQDHKTYQGFVITDRDPSACVSAVSRMTPAGDAISVVLVEYCHEGQERLYGCIDSVSQSFMMLSEEGYATSLSQYGRCVGGIRVEPVPSGASGKDIPKGQPGVSGGFVPGAQSR